MTRLKAPQSLANTELSVRNATGTFSRIKIDENGELFEVEGTTVLLDGDGNKLRVVTVEGEAGQPDQHFFAFDEGDIPPELNEFVTELDIGAGETVVPARYVRGVHGEKRDVPLSEELQDVLRADTSLGPLLQEANDPEDEPEADEEVADLPESQDELEALEFEQLKALAEALGLSVEPDEDKSRLSAAQLKSRIAEELKLGNEEE